jgi:hypothetical protein
MSIEKQTLSAPAVLHERKINPGEVQLSLLKKNKQNISSTQFPPHK